MDRCGTSSAYIGLYRRIWPAVCLLLIPKIADAQDSVTSSAESTGIDREWFLYGSLISLAAALIFLMLFLCVCFGPCFEPSSQADETGLRRGAENEPNRGSMYNLYPGAGEPEDSKSMYELAKLESQNSRDDSNRSKIAKGSPFLIRMKKLSDPSEKITITDKAVIESEIHETIRHLSETAEPGKDVTSNGNCEESVK